MKYIIAQPQWIHQIGNRANQEDCLYPFEAEVQAEDRLFILCDGMGGHAAGEVASQTVCQCMSQWFALHYDSSQPLTNEQLGEALNAAYDGLDVKDDPDAVKKMGTTMTFVALHEGGVTMAHIGDSRIYHIRPKSSEILYKSRDHSLVNDLVRIGEMTEEEARVSSSRNVITRAMQPNQAHRSKADIKCGKDVKPGDYFYMCSDGMLEQMEDQELVAILSDDSTTDEQKKEILLEKTAENKDNHSAFLIHVLDVQGDSPLALVDSSEEEPVIMMLDADNEPVEERDESLVESTSSKVVPSIKERQKASVATQPAKHQAMVVSSSFYKKVNIFLRIIILIFSLMAIAYAVSYYVLPLLDKDSTIDADSACIEAGR